jgi:hypothetical protein
MIPCEHELRLPLIRTFAGLSHLCFTSPEHAMKTSRFTMDRLEDRITPSYVSFSCDNGSHKGGSKKGGSKKGKSKKGGSKKGKSKKGKSKKGGSKKAKKCK